MSSVIDGPGLPDYPGIAAGDPWHGTFTYDTAMSLASSVPGWATYEKSPPISPLGISYTVGPYTFSAGDGAPLCLHVANDWGTAGSDLFMLCSFDISETSFPSGQEEIRVHLVDQTGTVFADTTIPGSLSLASFDWKSFWLYVGNYDPTNPLEADFVVGLTFEPSAGPVIPEPASLSLLVLGGVMLIRRRGA